MASEMAARRLRKELLSLKKTPIENIEAVPLESNILEWHYVIRGTKGTPYEGGYYHGKLKFPPEYPMKPPSVLMLTPNGRFKTGRRLCLSMSDFHPETWNPMWSVSSILTGLYSFMLETQPTLGSMESTDAQKRRLAAESLEASCRDPIFRKLFPEYVQLREKQEKEERERKKREEEERAERENNAIGGGGAGGKAGETGKRVQQGEQHNFILVVMVALLAIAVMILVLQL